MMMKRGIALRRSEGPGALLPASLSDRTRRDALHALSGGRSGVMRLLPFLGPAVIASIAYMDPGNFATNIQAGSRYGYALIWVVVVANVIAMVFQALSARLGIVTGRSLPQLCRDHFPRRLVWPMWAAGEIAAVATDLAEFVGGAIGLSLLTGLPLLWAMGLTGFVTYALLTVQGAGFRPLELLIGFMVLLIGGSYLLELLIAPVDWPALAYHAVMPSLPDRGAVTLAVGIVGATVMPHAIYLHSSLTQDRIVPIDEPQRRRLLRLSDSEVLVALGFAGLVNIAMVAMAAAAFHDGRHNDVATIQTAYRTLAPLLGHGAAVIFMLALIASGLSSSVVGTMAGQVIMQGFLRRRIPLWLRRLLTMLPAFIVVASGVDTTSALVWSQVALSLVLPVPMIALLLLMRRRDIMGDHVLTGWAVGAAAVLCAIILGLNALLVAQAL